MPNTATLAPRSIKPRPARAAERRHAGTGTYVAAGSARGATWVEDGRVVSLTLNDPKVKKELNVVLSKQRENIEELKNFYIANGFLTPGGKLAKRYGG